MRRPSLKRLETAFTRWRDRKQDRFEPVPEELLKRAQAAATVHGVAAVTKAAGLARRELFDEVAKPRPRKRHAGKLTSLLVPAPSVSTPPCLEVELPGGVCLRFFGDLSASVALVRELCSEVRQ